MVGVDYVPINDITPPSGGSVPDGSVDSRILWLNFSSHFREPCLNYRGGR